jgi:hypothetical protein
VVDADNPLELLSCELALKGTPQSVPFAAGLLVDYPTAFGTEGEGCPIKGAGEDSGRPDVAARRYRVLV